MTRKITSFLLIALLLVGLIGCSSGQSANPQNIIITTGGESGTYYPLGGSLAKLWQDNGLVASATAQTSGGSSENLQRISKGEVQFGLSQNDVAYFAEQGIETFESKVENISGVAALYPEVIQLVVPKDSDIHSIQDLKGKRVSVGDLGSGNEVTSKKILAAAGLTYDDIEEELKSYSDSADAFKDGLIDAMFVVAGIPNAAIQDIAVTKGVRVISLEDELIQKLSAENPYYVDYVIEKGTYEGQDEDAKTIALIALLVARSDLSEDFVYNITKTMFENLDKVTPKGDQIKLETALKGMTIKVHPGAQKYYNEKGISK